MKMKEKMAPSVVDKVLDDRATTEEARRVSAWLATAEGQEHLAARLEEEASGLTEEVAESWIPGEVPERKMEQRFLDALPHNRRAHMGRRRWLVAAVLLPFVFLGLSVAFLAERAGVFSEMEYAELRVPCGEQLRVVLQDGTTVQLNSASCLRYPKRFSLFGRTVELSGEAYFDVAKDRKRPFVVCLDGLDVRVTGTKFNVKNYETDDYIRVTLDEGSVLLQGASGQEYQLHPQESAEYDRRTGTCRISVTKHPEQVSAWRSNSLNFYLVPLEEIIQVLQRQYDVRFVVSDSSLLESRFTLSTGKVNVEDVLRDLSAVSHVSFNKLEDGVYEVNREP